MDITNKKGLLKLYLNRPLLLKKSYSCKLYGNTTLFWILIFLPSNCKTYIPDLTLRFILFSIQSPIFA